MVRSGASVRKFTWLLLAAVLALVTGPHTSQTYATNQLLFAPVVEPIGVATRVRLLGPELRLFATRPFCTGGEEQPSAAKVVVINPNQSPPRTETNFATLPPVTGCFERYIEVSQALGGFLPDFLYVTEANKIFKISPDGSSVTLFTTIGGCGGNNTGITQDEWGSFGHKLIVTCTTGEVFTVGAGGMATLIADLDKLIENPGVAHPAFGSCGGCVFVAAEGEGKIYFVRPNGTFGVAASWPLAEAIHPIPPAVCNFGTSGGAFFTAIFSTGVEGAQTGIIQFPKSALVGSEGKILVTSEPGAIGLLTPNGTGYSITQWHVNIGQNEGGAFCARVRVPPGLTILNPPRINVGSQGTFKITFLSSLALNFFPAQIDTTTLRAGRIGTENSLSHCNPLVDENGDGILDLACHFFRQVALVGTDPSVGFVERVVWTAFTLGSDPAEDPGLEGFAD